MPAVKRTNVLVQSCLLIGKNGMEKQPGRGQDDAGRKDPGRLSGIRPVGPEPIPGQRPEENGDDRRHRAQEPFGVEVGLINMAGQELGIDVAAQVALVSRERPGRSPERERTS